MPRVSDFYGIAIYMYHREHGIPHFHVLYGEHEAVMGIDDVVLLDGSLPRRAQSMVFEWAATHQRQLRENWERAGRHESLVRIPGLE